jgi:hypothetical protein
VCVTCIYIHTYTHTHAHTHTHAVVSVPRTMYLAPTADLLCRSLALCISHPLLPPRDPSLAAHPASVFTSLYIHPLNTASLLVRTTRQTPGGGASGSLLHAWVDGVASGGPADRAGVRRGDLVLSVDGVEVKPGCEGALDALFEGPCGSAISVTFRHAKKGEPTTVELVRSAGFTDPAAARIPHDLDASGPCFACLPNPAPKMLGNTSIGTHSQKSSVW